MKNRTNTDNKIILVVKINNYMKQYYLNIKEILNHFLIMRLIS